MVSETLLSWAERAADRLFDLRRYPADSIHSRPKIVAHRGAWDHSDNIENTMKAFARAKELGCGAIELDIHFTQDGVPVVHHDPTLERCHQHSGTLCDLKFSDLRKAVPAVPTLEEVLGLSNLHFMLEVKTPLNIDQLKTLTRHLSAFAPLKNYHLLTLQPDFVRLSSATPEQAWILVGDIGLKSLVAEAEKRKLGGVAGHYLFMTKNLIKRLHDNGQKAGSGFLPTRNLYNREWARGMDWVFTNHLRQIQND
jgi:glycerophosphoryl diester phosphodiesterase